MHVLCDSSFSGQPRYIIFELLMFVNIETVEITNEKFDATFTIKETPYYIYKRHCVDVLINWLLNYKVSFAIWTSQTRSLTIAVLKHVFPQIRSVVKFIYTKKSCTLYNDTYVKNINRICYKSILVDFNENQLYFSIDKSKRNTLIIDPTANLKKILSYLRRILQTRRLVTL